MFKTFNKSYDSMKIWLKNNNLTEKIINLGNLRENLFYMILNTFNAWDW